MNRRVAVVLVLVALASSIWGVSSAYSFVNFNWIDNVTLDHNEAGGASEPIGTAGWGPRDHIQVWRTAGNNADLFYTNTSGGTIAFTTNSADNPYFWSQSASYGQAWCGNFSNSETIYTCQTTNPS